MRAIEQFNMQLLKTLYGLVQLAKAYYTTYKKTMEQNRFKRSVMDPCLFTKSLKEFGTIYVTMWVDDCFVVGSKEGIQDAINGLQKKVKVKTDWEVKDYLSCEFVFNNNCTKVWIGQLHLIKKLESTFEGLLPNQTYKTPGTSHQHVLKLKDDSKVLPDEEMKLYHSGVGQLLYLTRYTRPDISSAVRELSKSMSKATKAALKELF